MNGFNDASKDAGYYADLIAKGATLAKTDVGALGEAMSGASSSAAAYGQSAQETEVALLRLAQQNVTGSEAATMLNRTMTDLYAASGDAKEALDGLGVSAYDEQGNARELSDVLADLQDSRRTACRATTKCALPLQSRLHILPANLRMQVGPHRNRLPQCWTT